MYYYLFKEPSYERLYLGTGDWKKVFGADWIETEQIDWKVIRSKIDYFVIESGWPHTADSLTDRIKNWCSTDRVRVITEEQFYENRELYYNIYRFTGSAYADMAFEQFPVAQ